MHEEQAQVENLCYENQAQVTNLCYVATCAIGERGTQGIDTLSVRVYRPVHLAPQNV